jgi:hypothetical protein
VWVGGGMDLEPTPINLSSVFCGKQPLAKHTTLCLR